ncbi:hypothetical protein BC629DRAFT_1300097 [Irpex lacteus]|nr:hypothetical protein BC629DRAFT_1300097 [Irpex lacteus]
MREYDEEKVKNTKEDIDTLLTFAGLFSAALTAFLVESYSSLSLILMHRLPLIQLSPCCHAADVPPCYNSSSDPTIALAPAVPPPFQPSSNDIRVNVLWFASLIFS